MLANSRVDNRTNSTDSQLEASLDVSQDEVPAPRKQCVVHVYVLQASGRMCSALRLCHSLLLLLTSIFTLRKTSRLTLSQASLAGQTFRGGRETSGH